MYINDLVIEVTRKCDMRCSHCLRGMAQNKDMDYSIIDKVLSEVRSIGGVTFTGGEPTLGIKAIKYFIKRAKELGTYIGYFYVVSNGKKQSISLAKALIDLYSMCDEREMCCLCVSRDQFHDSGNDTPLYEALSFYNKEERKGKIPFEALLNEGMAYLNGYGTREVKHDGFDIEEDDELRVDNLVYISSNGSVVDGCDFSYDRIDEESLGNIMHESLSNIILKTKGVAKDE